MADREHFRTCARPPITTRVEILTAPGAEPMISYTRDLSSGGLFIEGAHGIRRDQRVVVRLSAPSSWEPLELDAIVCRLENSDSGNRGAALKFEGLSPEQSFALSALLASLDYGG